MFTSLAVAFVLVWPPIDNDIQLAIRRLERLGGIVDILTGPDTASVRYSVKLNVCTFSQDQLAQVKLALSHVTPISSLQLFRCTVDDPLLTMVGSMKTLERLEIGSIRVGDKSAKTLEDLKDLKVLHLFGIDISSIAMCRNNRSLVEIDMSFNPIDDAGFKHIGNFKTLEKLTANQILITDRSIDILLGLKRLKEVHLSCRSLTDRGIRKLVRLDELTVLNLDSTQLTDVGLSELAGMRSLKRLVVDCTNVTTNGVEKARKARPGLEIIYSVE